MAQKKKSTKQPPQKAKPRINRSQRVMVIIGILIVMAMVLPSLVSFFQ